MKARFKCKRGCQTIEIVGALPDSPFIRFPKCLCCGGETELDGAIAFSTPAHQDGVNHPAHYAGAVECIDALESALGLDGAANFCRGNVIKYLWRAGKKGELLEDLKKAKWYGEREIDIRIRMTQESAARVSGHQ